MCSSIIGHRDMEVKLWDFPLTGPHTHLALEVVQDPISLCIYYNAIRITQPC